MIASQYASPTRLRRFSVISAGFFVSLAISVLAAAATPTEIQKQRHDNYEALGDAFKTVRDNTKGSPDFAALEKALAVINKTAAEQKNWFPKGSGPEAGKTRAMPEIWSKPDEFAAAQKAFADKAAPLAAAIKAKDADALNKAFRELGGTCKGCHDKFRAPE